MDRSDVAVLVDPLTVEVAMRAEAFEHSFTLLGVLGVHGADGVRDEAKDNQDEGRSERFLTSHGSLPKEIKEVASRYRYYSTSPWKRLGSQCFRGSVS